MTDNERKYIDAYLPHPRDETLDDFEYYVLDAYDRVQRVFITDIAPDIAHDCNKYRVQNKRGVVHGYASDSFGYIRMGYLYDNKEDCKDGVHNWFDGWERLRDLQKKENETS